MKHNSAGKGVCLQLRMSLLLLDRFMHWVVEYLKRSINLSKKYSQFRFSQLHPYFALEHFVIHVTHLGNPLRAIIKLEYLLIVVAKIQLLVGFYFAKDITLNLNITLILGMFNYSTDSLCSVRFFHVLGYNFREPLQVQDYCF